MGREKWKWSEAEPEWAGGKRKPAGERGSGQEQNRNGQGKQEAGRGKRKRAGGAQKVKTKFQKNGELSGWPYMIGALQLHSSPKVNAATNRGGRGRATRRPPTEQHLPEDTLRHPYRPGKAPLERLAPSRTRRKRRRRKVAVRQRPKLSGTQDRAGRTIARARNRKV